MFRYYVSFLALSITLVSATNILIGMPFWHTILFMFGGTVFLFAVEALVAWVLHAMPKKWFCWKKRIFKVSKFERKFLDKMQIKKWKDKVPEVGQVCDFKKNKINSFEEKYLKTFLIETCYAEVIHIAMLLCGFLVLIFVPFAEFFNYSFWLILINALLNIPPILIQRYNRPKLELALIRAKRQTAQA